MSEIEVRIDTSDIKAQLDKLKCIKGGMSKAVRNAMNKTLDGMRTDSWGEIKSQYHKAKIRL